MGMAESAEQATSRGSDHPMEKSGSNTQPPSCTTQQPDKTGDHTSHSSRPHSSSEGSDHQKPKPTPKKGSSGVKR